MEKDANPHPPLIQPMDQNAIQNIKLGNRKLLLTNILNDPVHNENLVKTLKNVNLKEKDMTSNLSMWILVFCILALLVPEPLAGNPRKKRNNYRWSNRKTTAPPSSTLHPCSAGDIQCGVPQKFCNMFGCDCTPKPGAKCCDGYRYDGETNKCRETV
ncbi:hypothetical protein AVEN_74066-1 [Araneus ventricosus]|uniref:Uncharacterized protein n=1 Tax=Araneus ventricosus TaxID=182803 RepID=A0A4Y2KSN6_ARAVE|nr:hypothetical protein AVEN_74066-1 [Araneus ventricosus]